MTRRSVVVLLLLVLGSALAFDCPSSTGLSCDLNPNTLKYYPGLSSNTTSVTVTATGGAPPVGAVMIIQMQGGNYNNDASNNYGDGTGQGRGWTPTTNAIEGILVGQHEFNYIQNIQNLGSNRYVLFLHMNTEHSYLHEPSGNARFQVILFPFCATLRVNAEGISTVPAWDGSIGGVLPLVSRYIQITGLSTISMTGKGFRGGLSFSGQADWSFGRDNVYASNDISIYGMKGEGIAGTPRLTGGSTTYQGGLDCSNGAPANAGGGGSVQLFNYGAGGGGGGYGEGHYGDPLNWGVGVSASSGLGGVGLTSSSTRLFMGMTIITRIVTS